MWMRAFAVFVFVIVLESVHGIFREAFLVPAVGDLRARQIGFFVGSAIVLFSAWLWSPWIGATSKRAQLRVGLSWLLLLLIFEFGLGYAMGLSWERMLSEYDPRSGGLMAFGTMVMFFAPVLGARFRGLGARGRTADGIESAYNRPPA